MEQFITTAGALKYAQLQRAAEAFIRKDGAFRNEGARLVTALVEGNDHASRFTPTEATRFAQHWRALDQRENSDTGFSGTLFECIQDDPTTGARAGELVISLRSNGFFTCRRAG